MDNLLVGGILTATDQTDAENQIKAAMTSVGTGATMSWKTPIDPSTGEGVITITLTKDGSTQNVNIDIIA